MSPWTPPFQGKPPFQDPTLPKVPTLPGPHPSKGTFCTTIIVKKKRGINDVTSGRVTSGYDVTSGHVNMEENCEIIWKILKKGNENSEKIWKIWKKGKSNSERI